MSGGIETPQANRLASGAQGVIQIGDKIFSIENGGADDLTSFGMEAGRLNGQRRQKRLAAIYKDVGDIGAAKAILEDCEASEAAEMDGMLKQSGRLNPDSENKWNDGAKAFQRAAFSAEGAAFLLWLLAKKGEPSLQLKDVQALVNDSNAVGIAVDILQACQLKEIDPNSPGGTGTA